MIFHPAAAVLGEIGVLGEIRVLGEIGPFLRILFGDGHERR